MKKVMVGLFFTVMFLFGCSTPEKVAKLQGQGPAHIYPASYEKTWKAAVDSAWDLGLTVLRVSPEQGFISAKRGMNAKTFGEDVGIWLKEAGVGKTQVEVISRQKGIPMIEIKNWEDNLFQSIGERVGGLPFSKGTSPGPLGTLQGSGAKYPPPADVMVTQAPPVQPPPAVKRPTIKTPEAEQAALREQLKGDLATRESDVASTQAPSMQAPPPAVKRPTVKTPVAPQAALREQLKGYLAIREEEMKKENDPARRKFLESTVDYLREELSNVESKIARGTQ